MNKRLYGKPVSIPLDILKCLTDAYNKHKLTSNNNQEGLTRNKNLIDSKTATYQQLGRIKNWFDNYNGPKDSKEYELNGGDKMNKWVNDTLSLMRQGDNSHTNIQKNYYPEIDNIKDTQVDLSSDNRPSKSHGNPLSKYNIDITESLKRINEIMSKII